MKKPLVDYFKVAELADRAISQYDHHFVENPRRDWGLTGKYGKYTAYNWSERLFQQDVDVASRLNAVSKILEIVIQWNGDSGRPREIAKYGNPKRILDALLSNGNMFRRGGLTLADLEEKHYYPLVDFLERLSIIKTLQSAYAWVPISKFLHVINPCLFPIYDILHVWNEIMKPSSGAFRDDYYEFCTKPMNRRLPLSVSMNPNEYGCRFNANYVYWARENVGQATPEVLNRFERWFRNHVMSEIDPFNLQGQAIYFYGLAFEVIALGAVYAERQ